MDFICLDLVLRYKFIITIDEVIFTIVIRVRMRGRCGR